MKYTLFLFNSFDEIKVIFTPFFLLLLLYTKFIEEEKRILHYVV